MSKNSLEFPKKPTVSFVIRTLNEEKWLGKVLENLFMQSRLDFEIIIVDSGSTDRTLKVIKNWPIREVIKIKPTEYNPSYALNLGINESWGGTPASLVVILYRSQEPGLMME